MYVFVSIKIRIGTTECFLIILGICSFVPHMMNVAVREGKLNIPMNVTTSFCTVTWSVIPTSDELGPYLITNADCTVAPSLDALYYVNRSGLIIRNSTTTENGHLITTAGLYTAECAGSGNKTGAKLVVVRK